MPVISDHPERGLRILMERTGAEEAPWHYEGKSATPKAHYGFSATLHVDGSVTIELPPDAPKRLAERIRQILRTAWRHAKDNQTPPPRRLIRWRADTDGR